MSVDEEVNEVIHILCIEDSDDDFTIIKQTLKKNMNTSVSFDRASTCREGLSLLKKNKFDVLLLDYMLPDMNGLEVLNLIKKENLNIPIIMLTGVGDEHIAVQAIKEGISDYIPKSDLNTEKLSRSIIKVVDLTGFLKNWDMGNSDLYGIGGKRDTLTIIANTLKESVNGVGKTRLVYKTNLNFQSIKKYLLFLVNNDFLSVSFVDGKEIIKTTEKGLHFLKQIKNLEDFFE